MIIDRLIKARNELRNRGLAGIPEKRGVTPRSAGFAQREADRVRKAEDDLPDPLGSDREFAERYQLKLDGNPLDFGPNGYPHLGEIAEDDHPNMAIMASVQSGKTGLALTKYARWSRRRPGRMFGYYMPTQDGADDISSNRFEPFILSSPVLGPFLGKRGRNMKDKNQIRTRAFAGSTLMFLTTKGSVSTESHPFAGVIFDEVRRMENGDIMRCELRLAAQRDPWKLKISTAGIPESDIHAAFLAGDQHWFHTACKCPDGVVLPETYPDCLVDLSRVSPSILNEVKHAFSHAGLPFLGVEEHEQNRWKPAAYRCPRCKTWITNPRDGWWDAHAPQNYRRSYQFSSMLSPAMPAPRLNQEIRYPEQPIDTTEVYNSFLGMPFLDPEGRPITEDILKACERPDLKWPVHMDDDEFAEWKRTVGRRISWGFDHMGGYGALVGLALRPDGAFQVAHVQVCYQREENGMDTWEDFARNMVEFDSPMAVTEGLPNYDESLRFATRFIRRVFLLNYGGGPGGDMVTWKDVTKKKSRKGEDTGFKYSVSVDRTRVLQWALGLWKHGRIVCPSRHTLIQRLPVLNDRVELSPSLKRGDWRPVPIVDRVFFHHLKHLAFVKTSPSDEAARLGKRKIQAMGVGMDPHFVFAFMMAAVGLERLKNQPV